MNIRTKACHSREVVNPVMPTKNWIPAFAGMTSFRNAKLKTCLFLFFLATSSPVNAAQQIHEVNYFASLRAAETNIRSGPGQNYPVKFTFKLRGIPVRVISEYDNWNEIEDYEGHTGWVTQSLLTKKRTVMVLTQKSFINMHSKPNEKSRVIFRLENHVIGDYIKCVDEWCGAKINNKKGWISRAEMWGE